MIGVEVWFSLLLPESSTEKYAPKVLWLLLLMFYQKLTFDAAALQETRSALQNASCLSHVGIFNPCVKRWPRSALSASQSERTRDVNVEGTVAVNGITSCGSTVPSGGPPIVPLGSPSQARELNSVADAE